MKSLTLDTNESTEGVPSRLSISDCLDEFAVPERAINFEESLITTPSGVTRRLQMLNGNSKTDMLGYSLSDAPEGFVATVDDHRIRAPRPEQTQALKDEIRKVEHFCASLRTIPESELQTMQSEKPTRLECLVPQGKEELISVTPETTLDAALKKRVLIVGSYPPPNVDVSDTYLNPTEEILSDEDYFAVMELNETVINSLNVGGIDIQCSPHIRDLKVIGSLIYSHYTKVKWLRKRLYDLLNSGPSTHVLLKDRNNLLHISPNYEGKVTLLHICKECNKWCLYGYCVINLNEYEVRDV